MIIILENVRVAFEKCKDLLVNIFYSVGDLFLKRNKGGAFFEKDLERERGLLIEKEEEQGAKGKNAPFLLPLGRNRGGGNGAPAAL